MTDWISIIEKDYERIVAVQSRRSRIVTATVVAAISIGSLGWGVIRQYDLSWQDAIEIAPWWVAVNLLFLAVSALNSVYLRVHLPGLAEQIAREQKYPMLTPESVVRSLTFVLMALGSIAALEEGQPTVGNILFGFVAISMLVSGVFIIFNLNVRSVVRWSTRWSPWLRSRIRDTITSPRPFTSTLVGIFFFYSFMGLVLLGIVWRSDIWFVAVQASFLLSAFIAVAKRNLQESGRITLADKVVCQLLDLRVEILTNKTLTEDDIALRYRVIFPKSSV